MAASIDPEKSSSTERRGAGKRTERVLFQENGGSQTWDPPPLACQLPVEDRQNSAMIARAESLPSRRLSNGRPRGDARSVPGKRERHAALNVAWEAHATPHGAACHSCLAAGGLQEVRASMD